MPAADRIAPKRRRRFDVPDPGDEGAIVKGNEGPKLNKRQRLVLQTLIAQLYTVPAVLDAWAEQYPDFPPINNKIVYYYRERMDAGMMADAAAIRDQALERGLASKAVRVANMSARWARLYAEAFPKEGRPRMDIVRELRELEAAIRDEMEPARGINVAVNNQVAAGVIIPDDNDLDALIDTLIAERKALDDAFAAVPLLTDSESDAEPS